MAINAAGLKLAHDEDDQYQATKSGEGADLSAPTLKALDSETKSQAGSLDELPVLDELLVHLSDKLVPSPIKVSILAHQQ